MQSPSRAYLYSVAIVAALAGLLFGFDTGIISGALLFIEQDFVISTLVKELLIGAVLLGAMFGSLASGHLADQFGRRRILFVVAILFIIGTLITSYANQVNIILLGRLFIGLAIGMGSYTAPLYIAEIAPTSIRGGLVSLNQLAITLGILSAYLINYSLVDGESAWRWMFFLGLLPAITLALGTLFIPESPRWLIKQSLTSKATTILQRLRGVHDIDSELKEIQQSLQLKSANFSEIFSTTVRPVLFFGVTLGCIQQISGINTIIYYAPTIFKLAGFQNIAGSVLATVGIGIVNVFATLFAIRYLDKFGRRPLLLSGLLGMAVSLLGLSLTFYFPTYAETLRWIVMTCTFTYIICFAFSMGAILWVLVSEIFPLEVRATAMSLAIFSCWFWNFIVSSSFLSLLNTLGAGNTFMLYAGLCLLSFIFCFYKAPETAGVSLEQIENNIRERLPLRQLGQPLISKRARN